MTDTQIPVTLMTGVIPDPSNQAETDSLTAWTQHLGCSPTVCRAIVPVVSHELDLPPALFHHYHPPTDPSKAVLIPDELDAVMLLSPTYSGQSEAWSD